MDIQSSGYADCPHGPLPAEADYNGGKNDGFVTQYQLANLSTCPPIDPKIPMGYYTRETLPVLYALADNFTVCDHWFSSMMSSTWPNRKYLHSGLRDSDDDTQTLPAFPGFGTRPIYDYIEDCADPDRPGHKLTWKNYYTDLPFLAFWYKFTAFHASTNFAHVAQFVADCRADALPTISVIDPAFSLADDHPSHDVRLGQKFIGLIVDALTNSESWKDTALVILYDENGGFYDHVAPPLSFEGAHAVDKRLGFRVPALVISPYTRTKGVSKVVFDHTSIMKSISDRWNVTFPGEFGPRWMNATSIWESCFNFTQTPTPMGTFTGVPNKLINWGTGVQGLLTNPTHDLLALVERIFVLPELKALDKRSSMFDILNQLERDVISLKRMS
jgi:phospholipase C